MRQQPRGRGERPGMTVGGSPGPAARPRRVPVAARLPSLPAEAPARCARLPEHPRQLRGEQLLGGERGEPPRCHRPGSAERGWGSAATATITATTTASTAAARTERTAAVLSKNRLPTQHRRTGRGNGPRITSCTPRVPSPLPRRDPGAALRVGIPTSPPPLRSGVLCRLGVPVAIPELQPPPPTAAPSHGSAHSTNVGGKIEFISIVVTYIKTSARCCGADPAARINTVQNAARRTGAAVSF